MSKKDQKLHWGPLVCSDCGVGLEFRELYVTNPADPYRAVTLLVPNEGGSGMEFGGTFDDGTCPVGGEPAGAMLMLECPRCQGEYCFDIRFERDGTRFYWDGPDTRDTSEPPSTIMGTTIRHAYTHGLLAPVGYSQPRPLKSPVSEKRVWRRTAVMPGDDALGPDKRGPRPYEHLAGHKWGKPTITQLIHGTRRTDPKQGYWTVLDVPEDGRVLDFATALKPEFTWHLAVPAAVAIPNELKGKMLTEAELREAVPELEWEQED